MPLRTREVAEALDIPRQKVHERAKARGVRPVRRTPNSVLWPDNAVELLKRRKAKISPARALALAVVEGRPQAELRKLAAVVLGR